MPTFSEFSLGTAWFAHDVNVRVHFLAVCIHTSTVLIDVCLPAVRDMKQCLIPQHNGTHGRDNSARGQRRQNCGGWKSIRLSLYSASCGKGVISPTQANQAAP